MITTQTPLHLPIGGTGAESLSDVALDFSVALNRHVQVSATRPDLDRQVRIHGPNPETAARSLDVNHELAREALLRHGLHDRLELASISPLPSGLGLGASSSFLVGLLQALHALKGEHPSPAALAQEACIVEIDVLGRCVGKQAAHMAAFGGVALVSSSADGGVAIEPVAAAPEVEAAMVSRMQVYYTGVRRTPDAASTARSDDPGKTSHAQGPSRDALVSMNDLVRPMADAWRNGDAQTLGGLIDEHWALQKSLSPRVSWPHLDAVLEEAKAAYGMIGGKLTGAGGGGVLIMIADEENGARLEAFMARNNLPRLDYGLDKNGARVLGI